MGLRRTSVFGRRKEECQVKIRFPSEETPERLNATKVFKEGL